MALEIERRFLVKPEYHDELRKLPGREILQGYISRPNDSLVLRIRSTSFSGLDAYFLTIKRTVSSGINKEFETEISRTLFHELFIECGYQFVKKYRRYLVLNELTFEIDFFQGKLDGIIIAEVELNDLKQSITLPDFLGKEITDVNGISNFDMAVNPEFVKEALCQQN